MLGGLQLGRIRGSVLPLRECLAGANLDLGTALGAAVSTLKSAWLMVHPCNSITRLGRQSCSGRPRADRWAGLLVSAIVRLVGYPVRGTHRAKRPSDRA